jgi:hypothetical protein
MALGTWMAAAQRFGFVELGYRHAHLWIGLVGFLLPALAFWIFHLLEAHLKLAAPPSRLRLVALLYAVGAAMAGTGLLLQPSGLFAVVAFLGILWVVAAAVVQLVTLLALIPKSVVDVARDPLTKGDDACLKQLKFAHFFLVPGLLLLASAYAPYVVAWEHAGRLALAGFHLVFAGFALLATYGVSHLVVPRLSGVPAIAAGAIKGELHSTMLGLVLLAAGFLAAEKGLLIAGGAFVFLGAFTFMGVLGANIMRNKSRTQRVTPEFTYVPWTFAGVFWLIAGVLLGIFLNAIPDLFADRRAALTFAHVHAVLLGGVAILLLGYATRSFPAVRGQSPPPFSRTRWSFWALNLAVCLLVGGNLAGGPASPGFLLGGILAIAGLIAWFISLRRNGSPVLP